MTIRKARALVAYWQTVLGLTEWEIVEVRWCTPEEADEEDGHNNFYSEGPSSKIALRKDQDDYDMEVTIVHELLHLMVDGHKDIEKLVGRHYDRMHERALNRLAKILISLDRLGKG